MWFRIVYTCFVVCSIFLGSLYIGPMTLRQITTAFMFVFCIKEQRNIWYEKSWIFYLLFLLIFGFSSLINGYGGQFLKELIGYYFVAFIGCWATVIIRKKYDISLFIYTIIIVGVFNAIITIFQAFGVPWALSIGYKMNLNEIESLSDKMIYGSVLSSSIPGLIGATSNGYFLLISSVLSTYLIIAKTSVLKYIPFIVCFIGSFMCQQRMAFFINVVFFTYFLINYFKNLDKWRKLLLIINIMLCCFYIIPNFLNFSEQNEMRYSTLGVDGTGRERIYDITKDYIDKHLINANIYHFRAINGFSPHILFYNMMIYGGVFGFIFVFVALVIHVNKSIKIIFKRFNRSTIIDILIAVSLLGFIANSLTHNTSIITGDVLYWMLWGGICMLNNNLKKELDINKKQ